MSHVLRVIAGLFTGTSAGSGSPSAIAHPPINALTLEDRILYSATPLLDPQTDAAATDTADQAGSGQALDLVDLLPDDSLLILPADTSHFAASDVPAAPVAYELVMIDAQLDNLDQLVASFLARNDATREVEIVYLNPSEDGFTQVDQALAGEIKFDAVHFVTPGADGMLRLGNTWLDAQAIEQRLDQIQEWSNSLTADAELLFYESDPTLAVDREWIDELQQVTGHTAEIVDEQVLTAGPVTTTTPTSEVIFVDQSIRDYQTIVDNLLAQLDANQHVDIVLIDGSRDGLAFVTEVLAGYEAHSVSTVRFISHGVDGAFQLGATWVNEFTLAWQADLIASWQSALSADADLLIYGCSVASTADGQAFVQRLAELTQADIAASTDVTGHSSWGGNWNLEATVGQIEAISLDAEAFHNWVQELAISTNGAASSAVGSSTSSLTWSHTVASGVNRVMYVTIALDSSTATPTGVTYGGVAMTQVGRTSTTGRAVEIWRLVNPTVGTASVVVSLSASTTFSAGAVVYNGVDTSNPDGNYSGATGTGTVASVNVSSATGDLVLDITNWDNNPAGYGIGSGQTNVWSQSNAALRGVSTTESGAATVTMSSTVSTGSVSWGIGAVSIHANPNDLVVAVADTPTVAEDTPTVIDPRSNDTDTEGNSLTIVDYTSTANGTLSASGGALLYSPTSNYNGGDSFSYMVLDSGTNATHFWGLNGNGTDAVGGITATPNNGPTTVAGHFGQAYAFDEVDDYLSAADFAYNSSFTVSFDFRIDDNTGTLFQYIYSHGVVSTANSLNIYLGEASHASYANQLFTNLQDGNDAGYAQELNVNIASLIGDGQWHTYTLTVTAGQGASVYIDGVLSATNGRGGDGIDPTGNLVLGARQDFETSRFYGGYLDNVLTANRAFTGNEALGLHNLQNVATATITVSAVNDAPTAAITPTTYSATEQTTLTLSGTGLVIADLDAASNSVRAVVSVVSGTITASAGSTGAVVSGSGTSTVTINGTLTQVNNVLAGASSATVSYIFSGDAPPGSDTLTLTANDLGNTGSGGALTASDTATINIAGVNDAPTATITPVSYAVNEQATLTLHGTGLSIADVDAASGTLSVTLTVGEGTLTVTAGTTGAAVSNSGTNAVTITGTVTQINNVLAGNLSATVTYVNNFDVPSAATTLTMTVNDQGNTGSGGALTANDSAAISITALNDAPVNIYPSSRTVLSGNTLVFSTTDGSAISITDVDAGGGTLRVTLSVTNGTLTLGGTTGLTFTVGDGTADTTMTFTGTATNINNALNGLSYTHTNGFTGVSSLQITTNDLGNSGSGGALVDTDTVSINVLAPNSASLWLTSDNAATASGGVSWGDSEVVRFGDPNLTFEPGTTAGTFTSQVNLEAFAADGNTNVAGIHWVGRTTTVGSGGGAITLQRGDILFSVESNETFGGVAVDDNDIIVFRPNSITDLSGGSFFVLINSPTGDKIRDFALVETTMTVGGVTLNAGDLLISQSGATYDKDIWRFVATTTGDGTTTGTFTEFVDGADIGFGQQVGGVALVQQTITLGGATLQAGQLILSLRGDDSSVGSNVIAVTKYDLFTLTVSQAGSTTTANATLLFQGSDVGISAGGEEFYGVSLVATNYAPVLAGGNSFTSINEDPVTNTGTLVSSLVSGQITDFDSGALTGIAVTAVDNTNGAWQYSINGGTVWNSFGSPSNSAARLLSADASTLVRFVPNANYNGTATITFRAWDQTTGTAGSTADASSNGGFNAFSTATATSTITINAVNDAPTAAITPASYSVNEQATLTLHGTGLSIGDIDAASSTVQATLSVVSGTLNVSAGTTGVTVSGSGSNSVILTGTLTQINNLLAGNLSGTVTYTLNSDTPPASDTLTLTANDQGNTGSGGALTSSDTAAINITALNDAPTATITPTTYAVNEQATLTLHGTGLSIADVDDASGTVQATLSVVSGTLSVSAGTTGVTISGSGTTTVTLTGTLTQINNLLAGNLSATLTYTINSDAPPASDMLTLTANDQGNTGSGGALTASDTATINITALNDAPTATITPTTYAVNEQATLNLHGTGLSIADADAAAAGMRVTLSVGAGVLNVTAGSTGASVANSGTTSVLITGTITQINDLLAGLSGATVTYTNNSDTPSPTTTLTLDVNDRGNTGAGGNLLASDTATINITALNDAPVSTITPTSYVVNEQATLILHGTGLAITDVDAASGVLSVTLSAGEGTLTVTAGSTGATVSDSGTGSVTITGSVTQINDLLAGNSSATVTYVNSTDTPSASTTLTMTVNDQGNTGNGGALTASDTAVINITALNDAPTATITPTTYAVNEQATLILHGTGLSIADVDDASGTMSVTLSVGEGTLTITAGSTGATVTNSGTSTVTITGTVTQVNNLLAGNSGSSVSYVDNTDTPSASTTLTMAVNDQGNTGSGGALTATDTATINISAVNDAPTATITPTTFAVNEQATLNLHGTGLSIADADAASGTMSVTLSVGEGTLTITAGSTGATVTNSGTSSVTVTGTVAQINNLLAGNNSTTVSYVDPLDNPVGSTTLTMTVNDQGNSGSGGALLSSDTAAINITAINDAPTTNDVNASGVEDSSSVAITLTGSDVDGTVTQFQLSGLPANGTLYLDAGLTTTVSAGVNYAASGQQLTLYFTPTADWNGVTTFQYFAADDLGLADGSPNTATLTITAVNDAPIITSNGGGPTASVSLIENTTAVTTVTASDIDLPLQTLTYSIVNTGDGALFAINGAGVLTFIAAPDYENPGDIGGNNVYDVTVQVSDGVTTDTQVISVTVTNGNETPTATITPASYSVNEQATLTLHGTGLSIADSDAGSGTVSVTLSVGEGTLSVSAGLTGASVASSGTSSVTLTGTISQINSLLAGNLLATVTYTDNTDAPSASTTLTLLVNDLGNSGAGGPLTASDTATINITALNDAPTATITPTSYAVNEQATLTLHGTGLSIADADAVSGTMSVTLSVGEGTLTVTAGTTGATVSNSGTANVTITGTVTQINNLLAGNLSGTVTYTDNTDTPSASTTLTLAVNDQGNTGSGGALTDSDTATINIAALNDAPTATITPTTYSVNEQATLTLHGTGLNIADIDAASSTVRATLSVVSGTISATAGTTGVTVAGSGTNTVTLTGTLTQINNLLAGNLSSTLTYTLNSDTPPGSDTLTLTANDQGNTGSGGALTSSDTATINITALNDAPTATITPTSYAVNEQATLTLHGTGLSIADADAVSGTMSVTLSVGEGTLAVSAGSTGATVTNSGTSNVTITGTVAQINNLLAGNLSGTVTYTDNTDTPSASTTLTLAVNDQGNTGSGGALTASDTATINITALNDAPTATITPTTYSVNEQAALTLHGTGLSIADVDAASSTVRATLSVVSGTVSATAGTTGVTVVGSGTNTVTLTGTLTQINDLLAGNLSSTLTYNINSDTPPGSDTLTLTANDQGNTGSGGALTSSDTATINISALNDAPTATITPTSYAVNEQATLTLHGTGLSIADADAVSGTMSVTLSVGEGTLAVSAGSTGATVTNSGTSNVTITGTVAQINNLLAGNLSGTVTYTDNTDTPSASTTLTLAVNDQGNTGSGGALTASDTATITITALNDAPIATITPTSYSANEQATLTLHGTGLSIADADGLSGTLQATLSVGTGTLTVAAGTTGVTVAGSGSSSVTLTGTIAQINDLLAGDNAGTIDYVLNSDTPSASTTLTLAVNDQGNTGSGGALTASDTATINITALNDAPTATITPTSYAVNEQATLTLHGTGLSIADVDAASSTVRATLSVVSGTISATAGTTGVTVAGSGTNTVTLTGTLTQINNLLAGNLSSTLTYTLNSDTPPGSDTLTLTANDQGNTGSGGALTSSDTATISITALNDAPTANITPTTYTVNEQATLTLHGTGLSIADADAVSGTMSVTLSVGEGTLTVSAGTTGATVTNSGTSNVTITGTVAQINNLLAGNLSGTVTYTDNTDTPSASTTLTMTVNDQGNTGSGGALTAGDTATINITALNDVPTAIITPTSYTASEQTMLTLQGTGLVINDVDAGGATMQVTLSVTEGRVYLTAGTTGATVAGSGTSTATITGTLTQINDILAGNSGATLAYYNHRNNPSPSVVLTMTANDLGNTGSGGALTATDTVLINIVAFNNAPVTDSVSSTAAEDVAATTVTITGSDVDGTIASFQLTSLPTGGTLYLDAGLTTLAATGVDYSATSDQRTFYFVPNANWNGVATFQYFATDDLGQADPALATGTITISATNDAPTATTNSVTLAGVNEDTVSPSGATVSALFGSAYNDSLDQVSGGSSANNLAGIAITANTAVSATQGNWQYYNGSSWVNISTSVSTTSSLVLSANTQLRFLANADYNGTPGTLTVRLIDDSAGAVTSGTTVNVTTSGGSTRYSNLANAITLDTSIAAVNDAPTATITPASYTVNEQVTLTLHGTGLTVGDVDVASGTLSVTLSVGEGTLNVAAGSTGAVVANSGTSSVTITGTVTQINNLLAGNLSGTVTYVDNTNTPSASTVLTLSVDDQGNSGSGGPLTANDTATINLTAVNDAPTASITPTTYAVNEQATLALHGTGLAIADVDAASGIMRVTLSVGQGTLTVTAGTTGATVSGSGTATVTLTGTVTQLNDLLAGNNAATIDYFNSSNTPASSTTLTMTVNDQGNTGSGGALTATDTATINITALNDAPTATITPTSYTVNEQTQLTLHGTGLSIADVDASGAVVVATLSVGEGTLTATAGSTGATVSGSGTSTLTLTGTVTQINNLLAGNGIATLRYIDNTDAPSASTTLTLTVDDQGNTGSGGALTGSDTATINITNVNDAPVINNATFTLAENTANATVVGSIPVTDPDVIDTHTYSITAGNTGGAFTIDNNGQITVANVAALDYETTTVFTLTVRVQDAAGAFDTSTVTVNLTDVNEFAVGPVTDNNGATNQVNENAANGTTVGLTARAVDTDPTDVVTYTLDDNAGGRFAINVNTGVVTVAGALNAETAQSHTIIVRATSSDGSSSVQSFTINVLDLNEFPIGPVSDAASATNEVAENSTVGTVVGVTALAVDSDVTATVTYALTNSAGGRFAIDANTGVVTVAGGIDAEVASSYTITVRATSSDGSNTSQSFVINVLDVNESPVSAINDTNAATNQVSESAAIGATVGLTAFADDTDATDTVSYSLDDDAGGLFAIDATTGVVTVAAALDAETATIHTIIVRATSSDTSATTRTFTINVLDVNEYPVGPLSDSDPTTNAVLENAVNGTTVGITALAVDSDVTATVTYSLDDAAGGRFAIDNNTGLITVAGGIDYEAAASYTVIVRATSSDTSFVTQSFTINILDVNDNPPTVDLDANNSSGATGLDYETTFTEDAGPVAVGDFDLTINDPDSPIINSVVITITNRLDGNNELLAANVSGTSITAVYAGGVLTLSGSDTLAHYQQVLQSVTYENLSQDANLADRLITVQASDGTLIGPVATTMIHLLGTPDAPTITAPTNVTGVEDTPLVLSNGLGSVIRVDDVDSGSVEMRIETNQGAITLATTTGLTFVTGDGADDSILVFRGTRAQVNAALDGLTYQPQVNFNGTTDIVWTVTDLDGLSNSHTTHVAIDPVNDAPTIAGPATFNADEDLPRVLSTAQGNAIQVDDVDGGDLTVTLTTTHGTLSLNGLAGLTFLAGDGTDDDTMTFGGTQAVVNAALDGLRFVSTQDYHGPASITTTVDDQGNAGTGGPLSATLTSVGNIASVNDAPVGTPDLIQTRNIDTILITANAWVANDTDVDGDALTPILVSRPRHGTLVDSGSGAWLYVPDATYFGPDTFTYVVSDGQLTSQPITVTIDISIGGGPGGGSSSGGTVTGGVVNIATQAVSPTNTSLQSMVTAATSTPITSAVQETQSDGIVGPSMFADSLGTATLVETRPLLIDNSGGQLSLTPLLVRQDFMSRQSEGAIARLLAPITSYTPFNVTTMNTMLDALRDEVEMRWDTLKISTSSATVTAVGLTAGYAIWALRGAHLFATLLTTVPAWWSVDPLPILTATRALKMREDDQDESLADIASGRNQRSSEAHEKSGVS